jgi:hypothetical protein
MEIGGVLPDVPEGTAVDAFADAIAGAIGRHPHPTNPVGISSHALSSNNERAAAASARDGLYIVRKRKQDNTAVKVVIDLSRWKFCVDHVGVPEGVFPYLVLEPQDNVGAMKPPRR